MVSQTKVLLTERIKFSGFILETTMAYDDVITKLGNFGRYQKRMYLLLCLPAVLCAFHDFSNTFLQAKPNHRCQLPTEFPNSSYDLPFEDLNASFPYDHATNKYSSCSILINGSEAPCNNYIYDHTVYKSSIVTEWNIVCGHAYLTALSDSMYMLGTLLGSFGFGVLSDKLGRRIIFFTALVLIVIFGLLMGAAPNLWSYIIFRLIVGSAGSGIYSIAYVIAMEMVGPKSRIIVGVVYPMFFSSGYMLIALFAYFIKEWRYLQISLSLPGVAFFCYWWSVSASINLNTLKKEEAKQIIRAAARENKVNILDDDLHTLLSSDLNKTNTTENSVTILGIFKYSKIIKIILVLMLNWMIISMTYFGLSWNTSSLGGNDYVNFAICGAVEIPAYIFILLTLNRWGRKYVLSGCMVTSGLVLLLTLVVPTDFNWATVTLAMIGKLFITSSYDVMYVLSVEQFPTTVRNAGLGLGVVCANIGSIVAPIVNLTGSVWKPLPLTVFGILSVIGGCASLTLSDTTNRTLPTTIADVVSMESPFKEEELEKLKA
ncbi:hypothetical protein FQR65_LT11614 [Abscondita terminalis]|nr:hypothetical protein FQR65_LT11614 [Abscondita terminalis]